MSRAAAARTAVSLFAASAAVRAVSWLATSDRGAPHAVGFQGDAPVWQDLAQKAAIGAPDLLFELPLRPPGMPFLVAQTWDGDPATAFGQRLLWNLVGALVPVAVWLLARQGFAARVALVAGAFAALSTNLVWLGSGPHAESPYLLLALLGMLPLQRLHAGARAASWVAFGAWHGALCLLRPEHALVFAAFAVVLWSGQRTRRRVGSLAIATVAFAAAILPWQLHAIAATRSFEQASVELPSGALPWEDAARARIAALPSPTRAPALLFVDATMRHRGKRRVSAADVDVLVEAYGLLPAPLPMPFVALYGGLNFFLGNAPEAAGGFSTAALHRPPPLLAHPERFSPEWLANLPPPGQFSLSYPPHWNALAQGTRFGLAEIAADPVGWLGRCAVKLQHAWQGAATGLGSLGAPMGLSGVRRQVDLVVADTRAATAWRLLLLAAAAFGVSTARASFAMRCWLAFAVAKLATVLLFFGYARQGALLVPLVGLGAGLAWDRVASLVPQRLHRSLAWSLCALFVLGEIARLVTAVTPTVDGTPFDPTAPTAPDFTERRIHF